MADNRWIGGASRTTQVDTITIALTWANLDTMTTRVTAENGTTYEEVDTIVSGSDNATNTAAHLADINTQAAVANSLFSKVTWTNPTATTIVGTAKTSGTPFYCTASETTSGDGTWTRASTTANSGPNDLNTAANWSAGTALAADENLFFVEGSYAVLYGLDQSAPGGSGTFGTLNIGPAFVGGAGDNVNGYYMKLTCGADSIVESNCDFLWLEPTCTNLTVTQLKNTSDALHYKGDVTNLYLVGEECQGTVTLAAGGDIDNIQMHDCYGANVSLSTGYSNLATLIQSAGKLTIESCKASTFVWNISGGHGIFDYADQNVDTLTIWGGKVEIRDKGVGTTLLYAGELILGGHNAITITMGTTTQYGGIMDASTGLANITWSAAPIIIGGKYKPSKSSTVTTT